MALTIGGNVPSSVSGTGSTARASLLADHIFNAGLEKPEILEELIVKFPDFWFNKLLETVPDMSGTITSREYTWQILDRTRKGATISSLTGGTAATAVLTLDIAASGSDLGYFLVGDVIRVADSGENGRVTAVGDAGGFQTISVVRSAGGNWSTGLVLANMKIGHISTGFAPGSSASGGTRVHLPGTDYSVTSIHRRGWTIERGAFAQKTYVGDKSWYFQQEDIEQKEFMRDFQADLIFGQLTRNRSGVAQSRGLLEYAEESGQKVTFSESQGVSEGDYISLVEALLPQQGSEDIVMLMGNRIFLETQQALGNNYRSIPNSEKPAQVAGLNFQSYQIGGKNLHFKMFDVFSDEAIVPSVTPSSTAKDFKNVALALDMGMVSPGQRNIQVKYLEGAKFIQKAIEGMVGDSYGVASAYDGIQMELLSEYLVACLLPNRLGLVYADN